jgi:hypothetical protein
MAIGMMLNTPLFYIGASVDHLLEPSQNIYSDDFSQSYTKLREYSVQLGTTWKNGPNSEFGLSPQVLFSRKGNMSEAWGNVLVNYRSLIAGGGISSDGSKKGTVGARGKHLRLMYSYDLTESAITKDFQGSHEVSLRILVNSKDKGNKLAFL